jgi:hypothetical protein
MKLKLQPPFYKVFAIVFFFMCFQTIIGQNKDKTDKEKCVDYFYKAREDYYNGDFGKIHKKMVNCINEFEDRDHKKEYFKNSTLVFQVYKLITTAFYETNEDFRAEEMEQRLVKHFSSLPEEYKMSLKEVIEKLENTNF